MEQKAERDAPLRPAKKAAKKGSGGEGYWTAASRGIDLYCRGPPGAQQFGAFQSLKQPAWPWPDHDLLVFGGRNFELVMV